MVRGNLSINSDDIEILEIEIMNKKTKNLLLDVVYRPPNGNLKLCEACFKELVSRNGKNNKVMFVVSDFNLNLLDSDVKQNSAKLFVLRFFC